MLKTFRRKKFSVAFFVTVGLILLCFAFLVYFAVRNFSSESPILPPPSDALFRQPLLPTEVRIENLLSFMTLEEKAGQMALVEKDSVHENEDIATYGLGALLSGMGAGPENNTAAGWKAMVDGFVATSRTSRLGIPILYGIDAIHGHSNVPEATIFPHTIGLGATGDAKLVERVARATAEELAATGIRWSYSPTLDLPRDIRWGRTYETFSDDPVLVTTLGAAYVRGLQKKADDTESSKISVLGTLKHFVGVGAMQWGRSSNENFKIDQGETLPDDESLREEYLPPFKAAIDAGALSLMVGLNSWGGSKLAASNYLVTTVLKEELGFKGFVVSDWYGVYEIPGGKYQAAVTAINAGVDMVMLPFEYQIFVKDVTRAVGRGDITEERINDAVRRILRAKFALGLFDDPGQAPALETVGSPAHRKLAREAVAQSLVLLKNDTATLPIKSSVRHIRVAGSAADNVGRQMGAWTVEWQGIDGNWLPGGTSILSALEKRAGARTRIEYDLNGNFPADDSVADVGIAVVSEKPYAEGWGDKEFPILDNEDLEAIKKLKQSSKKVVVIIVSGRPLLISNEISSWDALVAAWLPGSEGAGVVDVIFGDKPFVGTLPLPWPKRAEQLPITVKGETADGTTLLFPRYFGL